VVAGEVASCGAAGGLGFFVAAFGLAGVGAGVAPLAVTAFCPDPAGFVSVPVFLAAGVGAAEGAAVAGGFTGVAAFPVFAAVPAG
jgi:hypothetical protein